MFKVLTYLKESNFMNGRSFQGKRGLFHVESKFVNDPVPGDNFPYQVML